MILITISGYGQAQVTLEPACAGSVEKYGVSGHTGSSYIWDVEGGKIINGDGLDTVTIQWYRDTGDYKIEVYETNGNCTSAPSQATVHIMAPYVDLGPDQQICFGDSIVLDAGIKYKSPFHYKWNNNDTTRYYVAKKTEDVILQVTDSARCSNSDTIAITVNPLPVVQFNFKDTFLCDNSESFMIYASDVMKSHEGISASIWYLNSDPPYRSPSYNVEMTNDTIDTLAVVITNIYQCSSSDTTYILPCGNPPSSSVPNGFTPNGDGENDTWVIPNMEHYPDAILEIFDRWGRMVYRTDHVYEHPWDGTSKGKKLPMDAYHYVLYYKKGRGKPVTGTVNLIR